ncbi:hypothetical protein hmeg3_19465 [Herbaspirillum sp. meg3]|uniref:hypothetical protein n=1 Tax=Herbaspirillum sp. meg3 TaxID=2025949 RepID=UPI000B98B35E|nr:hypothetical protein [Herbaspirillum sp. meg3]ASU40253.1 hypothetical protein hmeg3_19465 [Herbaspirillum sp. meg3]
MDEFSKFPVSSSSSSSPLVSREKFAEMVFGTKEAVGIVIGWCNKGLIPTYTVGKYSLISVELLKKQCLDREFK